MMRFTKQIVVKAVALAVIARAVVSVGWKGNGPLDALAHYGCDTLDFDAPDYVLDFLPDWHPKKPFHLPCYGLCPDLE
jgi:hypothetical protein